MNRALELSPGARQEFDEAADWYEEQEPGLKSAFIEAVNTTLALIQRSPFAFPIVYEHDIRRALIPKFPFAVIFKLEENRIYIYAVFHTSRNPTIWQGRVD